MNQEKRNRSVSALTATGVALLVTVHFTMTFAFVQPGNPLRDSVFQWVNRYMSPYFTQNWKLFAPTPEEPSKHISVACRFADQEETPLIDVTAPHYEALGRYRLSSAQRLIRAQVYPLTMVHPPKDALENTLEKLGDSSDPNERAMAESYVTARTSVTAQGLRIMARMGSTECQRRYPDASLTEVRLVYSDQHAPPFSKRNDPGARGKTTEIDYGWYPFQPTAIY